MKNKVINPSTKPAAKTTTAPSIGWIGPADGCFADMRSRIGANGFQIQEFDDLQALAATGLRGNEVQRAIVACPDRLSMPVDLPQNCEVPIAIAASDWWIGSGITGSRKSSLRIVPWFRWWDFWLPWLRGTMPELLEPAPARIVVGKSMQGGKPLKFSIPTRKGLLVGLCNSTLEAYQALLRELPDGAVTTLHPSENVSNRYTQAGVQSASEADWILVDDSVLSTHRGMESDAEQLATCVPDHADEGSRASLIFCVSLPRWDLLQELKTRFPGQRIEMVPKPTTGIEICEILRSL